MPKSPNSPPQSPISSAEAKDNSFSKVFGAVAILGVCLLLTALIVPELKPDGKVNFPIFFTGVALLIFGVLAHRIKSLNWKDWTLSLEEAKQEFRDIREEIVHEVTGTIVDLAEDGSEQMDHESAFALVMKILEHHINNKEGREIELRLISVGLCYTWPWIKKDFISLAKNHRDIQFRWKIALVDYEYLSQFDLDSKNYNWIDQSRTVVSEIKSLEEDLIKEGYQNVEFEIFPYEMIPQWHGLLIDRKHLLIGRSDWDLTTPSGKPRLTVGSNLYRYYSHNKQSGYRRINLFRHWFGFYVLRQPRSVTQMRLNNQG